MKEKKEEEKHFQTKLKNDQQPTNKRPNPKHRTYTYSIIVLYIHTIKTKWVKDGTTQDNCQKKNMIAYPIVKRRNPAAENRELRPEKSFPSDALSKLTSKLI